MVIKVGDVFYLEKIIDRVFGYGPDKAAYSDYHPIPKGAKITVLSIAGNKARVRFENYVAAGPAFYHEKGIQEAEIDAFYNATDVYNKDNDGLVSFLHWAGLTYQAARKLLKKG